MIECTKELQKCGLVPVDADSDSAEFVQYLDHDATQLAEWSEWRRETLHSQLDDEADPLTYVTLQNEGSRRRIEFSWTVVYGLQFECDLTGKQWLQLSNVRETIKDRMKSKWKEHIQRCQQSKVVTTSRKPGFVRACNF